MAIKDQKETRELECKVSKVEIEDRKNKLVHVDSEINKEAAEKREEMAARNSTLRQLREERDNLIGAIQNGVEKRKVDCFWRQNDRLHKKELIRADTGAVVTDDKTGKPVEAAQSLEDKQEDLFDAPKAKKGEGASKKKRASKKSKANGAEAGA